MAKSNETKVKVISECPVCHSRFLEQEYKIKIIKSLMQGMVFEDHIKEKAGCHCSTCGVKFVFNAAPKKEDSNGSGK